MKDLIQHNKDITSLTTFGIPVVAKHFAEYSSVKELREIIRSDEFQSSEIFHIGGGSNLLFLSDYDGLILHSAIRGITDYRKDDHTVYVIAGAAENWAQFVDWCVDHGYAGLENMAYIPGEVGASAIQNVGAYGVEAKDVIYTVECYDFATNRVVTLENHECRFAYRDSIFKNEARGRYAVLRVCFRLKPSTVAEHLDYGPLKALKQDG
ncbi:MAG: FAD-binding protein, partial [Muribaculaceae bacterium]|nr:FAD-binding protein [Muribaculaceae bacterium]